MIRKKSLVEPDREKIEPGHRQWHYRTRLAELENNGSGRVGVQLSTTGNIPHRKTLQRGPSILGREEDVHQSGLALFRPGTTLKCKRPQSWSSRSMQSEKESHKKTGHSHGALGDQIDHDEAMHDTENRMPVVVHGALGNQIDHDEAMHDAKNQTPDVLHPLVGWASSSSAMPWPPALETGVGDLEHCDTIGRLPTHDSIWIIWATDHHLGQRCLGTNSFWSWTRCISRRRR